MDTSQRYGFYMPKAVGSPTVGGPATTAGGVIFIGASMDAKVRAYPLETGGEIWKYTVEAPSVSNPAVYERRRRRFVVFTAGGNAIIKDQLAVYTLPQE